MLTAFRFASVSALAIFLSFPAIAQKLPDYDQTYSAVEGREMRVTIDGLSEKYGVAVRALNTIARFVRQKSPGRSFGEIVALVQSKAVEAQGLKSQVAELRVQLAAIADASTRDTAEATLDRATRAFNDGDLDQAQVEFGKLDALRHVQTKEGFIAWSQAREALVTIARLRLDLDLSTDLNLGTSQDASRLSTQFNEIAWKALMAAGLDQETKASYFGSMDALLRAKEIYSQKARDFLAKSPDEGKRREARMRYALVLSNIENKTYGNYSEATEIASEYFSFWKDKKCPNCLTYALAMIVGNTSSNVFKFGKYENMDKISYMSSVINSFNNKDFTMDQLYSLYYSLSGLYATIGESKKAVDEFNKAEYYEELARKLTGLGELDILSLDFHSADTDRRRGESLNDAYYTDRAFEKFKKLVPQYAARNLYLGNIYKRMGAIQYGRAVTRSDCSILRSSIENIEKAFASMNQKDDPYEYSGLVTMRTRNQALLPHLCG